MGHSLVVTASLLHADEGSVPVSPTFGMSPMQLVVQVKQSIASETVDVPAQATGARSLLRE